MDGVSSSKVAGAAHHSDAEAAQDTKNKSAKGDVEGLSDSRPQTPPADPNSVQGEAKKMAELSIKEQEVEQPASSADDKTASVDDKQTDLSVDKQSTTKSDDAEKTDVSAADTGKADAAENTAQDVQPASSGASEAPDEGSKPDSSPAEESVPIDAEAEGESSTKAQSQQGAEV